jgi:hypothetical protein
LLDLIEVGSRGIECRVFRAASATAKQADPHSGVGRSATNERRLDEHDARSRRRCFQEAVNFI